MAEAHNGSRKTPAGSAAWPRRPRVRDTPWALLVGLALFVFAFSLWMNLDEIRASRFHPDESRWINRAYYIRELGDPFGETWSDQYLIRGQPPMGSYVIGLGLLLQGHDVTTNGPWDFHRGDEWNVNWNATYGNMPSQADLEASRKTNAVIGALTVAAVFVIATRLTNWIGGLAGALFLAYNPLQTGLSSQALSDALLGLIIALATLVIMALADRPTWPRLILLGVLLGAGASAKLSPLFLAAGLAVIGAVLLLDPWLRRVPLLGRLAAWRGPANRPRQLRLGWMLLALPVITSAFFVLSYPYLWPDPVGRTMNLIEFRQQEMESQARIWGDRAVDTRFEALERTWAGFADRYTTSGRVVEKVGEIFGQDWARRGYDPPLELAGLLVFAAIALNRGMLSRHFMALALIGGQAAAIVVGMRVDFNRYYLPILLFFAVCIGVLAGAAWDHLPRFFAAVAARRRAPVRRRETSAAPAD
ncbi:MAG: ArnT family glycosyltransferase [Thermomicrobiales bacterium]